MIDKKFLKENKKIEKEKEENSKKKINDKIKDNDHQSHKIILSFQERQNFFMKLYKSRKEEQQNLIQKEEKKFFKPLLISKKLNNTNYPKNKSQKPKEKGILSKSDNENSKINKIKKPDINKVILQNKINEIFLKIFKDLDSDEDDYISSYSINLKNIPKEVLKILQPLISELNKDKQEFLYKEEFIIYMNQLYEKKSQEEKNILLNAYKTKRSRSLFTNNDNDNIRNKHKIRNFNNNNFNQRKISNFSNRLATQYDEKFEKIFDIYRKNKENNKKEIFFDNKKTNAFNYFSNINQLSSTHKKNDTFSLICNYKFNNYIKNKKNKT